MIQMRRIILVTVMLLTAISINGQNKTVTRSSSPQKTTKVDKSNPKDSKSKMIPKQPSKIRSKTKQSSSLCPDNKHPHAIDLGLPSGTKWACCNIGATKPEAYGDYYAWGETEKKNKYDHVSYKYSTGEDKDGDGWYDNKRSQYQELGSSICGTKYDVAYVKWGNSWVMPSKKQFDELINNCNFKWTSLNYIKGAYFKSKTNGNSIFLPAAGYRSGTNLFDRGHIASGYYMSGTLISNDPSASHSLYFFYGDPYTDRSNGFRYLGHTVRPVTR